MNPDCKCQGPGWCERHKLQKGQREYDLCSGQADTVDCGKKYWLAWEAGKLGATAPEHPVMKPEGFCTRSLGMGTRVAQAIDRATAGIVQKCAGCEKREAILNHYIPSKELPPVRAMEPDGQRHLLMHIWPVAGPGTWQWNCDQVLRRADLFTGRRVVAIATSGECDHPQRVQEYLRDLTDEFIVLPNNAKLREVVTFVPLLERLKDSGPQDVTFYCHAKGVRHKVSPLDAGTTLYRWADTMYSACLDDWTVVRTSLCDKAMAGCFRRFGQFTTFGNHRWHYSGAFYWFRNLDVFQRNWRFVDQRFFGVESWPGHMFKADETACLLCDRAGDLYQPVYWDQVVEQELDKWRTRAS